MLKHKLSFCIILFLIALGAHSQSLSLKYNIQLKDDVIGILNVKRMIQGNKTSYLLDSKIQIQKVMTFDITYNLVTNYENGKLISSTNRQTTNARMKTNSSTVWEGNKYLVTVGSDRKYIKEKMIDYSLALLYFNEPIGKTKVWSDSFGKFLRIKPDGVHRYELQLPDGKKNYYNYKFGICSMVETEQVFTKVTFLLTK